MYSVFDANTLLLDLQSPTDLYFTFVSNSASIFATVGNSWKSFIANSLVTPFNMKYPFVRVWSSGVKYGDTVIFENIITCDDAILVGDLVSAMINSKAATFDCGGSQWVYKDSSLCIGCNDNPCPETGWDSILLPSSNSCAPKNPPKYASMISFAHEVVIKATVPKILSVEVESKEGSSITVTVGVLGFAPGGVLYCNAFRSSQVKFYKFLFIIFS
jgi:hypothetical protein